ncbi:MAG: SDR family oxidoreductase [Methanobacteriota archaeon]
MSPDARARNPLARQTALVTGGARRIGRAIALALSEAGADVVVHYKDSKEEAAALVEEIRARGHDASVVQADLASPHGPEALFEEALRLVRSPIRILVNNASVFPAGGLPDVDLGSLEATLRINAWSPLFLSRAFARRGGPGVVVNLLDTRVAHVDPARVAYQISKDALARITKLLAVEFSPRVRVNAVAPGAILPPEGAGPDHLRRLARTLPLRKHGDPSDVADAVLFLVRSRFVTGQTLFVDGGEHVRGHGP